jgi:hypothetical protein
VTRGDARYLTLLTTGFLAVGVLMLIGQYCV